jgi:hypothetical protein
MDVVEPYELFAVFFGDSSPSRHAFPITAPADMTVATLKEKVHDKAPRRFSGARAVDLILWKVLPLCFFSLIVC